MATWHYDLSGAEPIIRDMPVYDTALIDLGEFLMLGTTDPDNNADHGVSFITAYTGANTELVDALGIANEKRNTSSTVSVATLPGAGDNLSKCIINPGAVYLTEYDQATVMTVASTDSTTITITNLEDDIDTGFVYIVAGGTGASGNTGSLRMLTASASGSATMAAALTTTESGGDGTAIKILPKFHRLSTLNTAATKILSEAAAGDGVKLCIVENYIRSATHELQPLTYSDHRNLNSLSRAKFYADVKLLDHIFAQE